MNNEDLSLKTFSLKAFNNGDQKAFEYLFGHFYQALCYFSERMISDHFTAEEIAQVVLVKLWERRTDFTSFQSIKAFLYISTRNASLDHLDKIQRHARHQQKMSYLADTSEENILGQIYKTEVLREIYQAIAALPEKYRLIMRMVYIEGLSNTEIAQKLGVPVSTVSNQKARGLVALRKQLSNKAFAALPILLELSHFYLKNVH